MGVTQTELAKVMGISYPTVNRALSGHPAVSEKMRKRVLKAAAEMGYQKNFHASSLSRRRTLAIGMVMFNSPHSFWSDLIETVETRCRQRQYHLMLSHHDREHTLNENNIKFLAERGAEALIIGSLEGDKQELAVINSIANRGCPVLLIDTYCPGVCASFLGTDSTDGMQKVCQYLIDMGHRRIGFLAGPASSYTNKCRLEGYQAAMSAAELPIAPEWIIRTNCWGGEEAEVAAQKLLSLPDRPTAVMCWNDPAAFGLFLALRERGIRIPEDISLTGYAGMKEGAFFSPGLTTVEQDTIELGQNASRIILNMIEDKEFVPVFEKLSDRLLIRGSCAAPSKRV